MPRFRLHGTAARPLPARLGGRDPAVAAALALVFGPLGMLYSTVAGAAVMFVLSAAPLGFAGFLALQAFTSSADAVDTRLLTFAVLLAGGTMFATGIVQPLWAYRAAQRSAGRPTGHEHDGPADSDGTVGGRRHGTLGGHGGG